MKVYMKSKNFEIEKNKVVVKKNKEVYKVQKDKVYDELLPKIKEFIKDKDTISISRIQSTFSIGYPRAYKIMQELIEKNWVVCETRYVVNKAELTNKYHNWNLN